MAPTGPTPLSPDCPIRVRWASMVHRWDNLTFLHWRYDADVVQALLPPGLTVETFEGSAWVGLVPFLMEVRAARGGALPWLGHFCETNVRTYATAPDGTTGVWFLSLDAARLAAVVTARTTYRLPYFWSTMELDHGGDEILYTCRRRWPGPLRPWSRVGVRVGKPIAPADLCDLDHFLTARWRLYSHPRGGLRYALAQHDPWPLHHADVLDLDDQLVHAAGLPQPVGDPIVHWSPGVEVRIGFPHGLQH